MSINSYNEIISQFSKNTTDENNAYFMRSSKKSHYSRTTLVIMNTRQKLSPDEIKLKIIIYLYHT
jgi:hypothetical protein